MKRIIGIVGSLGLTAVLAVATAAPALAVMDDELVEELLAIEKTKLDPWYGGEGSTEVYVSHVAEDSTYFDPWAPGRLQGPAVIEYLKAFEGQIPHLDYEIVDPAADVRGDVVIFTYMIANSDPETGESAGGWMVTKVLSPTDEGWEVIHTHYGMPVPPPEPEG